ncbi:MAG: hypothetical protein ACMUJM_18200 [bacterium]
MANSGITAVLYKAIQRNRDEVKEEILHVTRRRYFYGDQEKSTDGAESLKKK